MQAGYFKTAWSDVKNTPGWFGKVLLLALIGCIPVFGIIVVSGYLYGWARDITWSVHGPMPKRIFGNEDGKLYSRGFFVLVIGLACALLPWIIEGILMAVTGFGSLTYGHGYNGGFGGGMLMFSGLISMVLSILAIAVSFIAVLFQWVGSMRMSVYGRLSAGFQFNKMWAMIRHDMSGLLRIFGMALLMGLIIGIIISIVFTILVFVGVFVGIAATGGSVYYGNHFDGPMWGMILGFGGLGFIIMMFLGYIAFAAIVFAETIIVRALGYWMRQFDIPSWRGQDDPMPFELYAAAARQAATGYPQQAPRGQQQPSGGESDPRNEERVAGNDGKA